MAKLSFKRRRFKSDVIKRAVWLYYRFNLSLRDVDEILAERGIDVSYEAIRTGAGSSDCRSREACGDADRPLRPDGISTR